jgi:hypothetical protein
MLLEDLPIRPLPSMSLLCLTEILEELSSLPLCFRSWRLISLEWTTFAVNRLKKTSTCRAHPAE